MNHDNRSKELGESKEITQTNSDDSPEYEYSKSKKVIKKVENQDKNVIYVNFVKKARI